MSVITETRNQKPEKRNQIDVFLVSGLVFLVSVLPYSVWAVPAFPTAEGYGANSVGGRGGRIVEVTNLNDSGPGSLRACAEGTGPRTCIFKVAGTIALNTPIQIRAANSYVTIAGQTAPGDGIQLKNEDFQIVSAHDVVVRFLRLRRGSEHLTYDTNVQVCNGILLYGPSSSQSDHVYNVMIDHSDVYWSCDDSSGAWGYVTDATIQWSLVAEGLTSSDFPMSEGANSKGILVGGSDGSDITLSVHHNLFAHNSGRLPLFTHANIIDYRNNIVYNWSACGAGGFGAYPTASDSGSSIKVNLVNNGWIQRPGNNPDCPDIGSVGGDQTKIYVAGNRTPDCPNGCTGNEWTLGLIDGVRNYLYGEYTDPNEAQYRSYTAFSAPPIVTTPTQNLESVLMANVGATKPLRDPLDTKVINDFRNRTGAVGRNGDPLPNLQSGTPLPDTDHDGMPDSWETARGLNPSSAADGALTASNGYTNVENYLNTLAGDPIPGGSTSRCDLDVSGSVSAPDIQLLVNAILTGNTAATYDVNRDGAVNAVDLQVLGNVVLGVTPCP